MNANGDRFVIWGAGAWGTALALHLARLGYEVHLWVFEEPQYRTMAGTRENLDFLPGITLPPGVSLFHVPSAAPPDARVWISVVPTQATRTLWSTVAPFCHKDTLVISASKGIEQGSLLTPCTVIDSLRVSGSPSCVALSGPSFAHGLCAGDPTTVVLACPQEESARAAQRMLSGGNLRGYTSVDRLGVELGGAVKNVIALACGIADGLGFGPNTQAALITRGLREISRLGAALGADPLTFAGLSGLGDLVLTCTGGESRNRSVGLRLGRGESLESILAPMKMVAEGVATTRSVADLALREGVDMPITHVVERVLFHGLAPRTALEELLSRGLKVEWG
jgi:glycerol-3-phosphate dehydrogenase (NAD(P)+)